MKRVAPRCRRTALSVLSACIRDHLRLKYAGSERGISSQGLRPIPYPLSPVPVQLAKRDNHYELAFEEMLRSSRQPYVAVDEARRSLVGGGSLKNLDFLVSVAAGSTLLVDVKGRRFPSGAKQPQYWRNWSTADDLRGLAEWSRCFGAAATPVLVFAYLVTGHKSPVPPESLFWWRDQAYGFVAIRSLTTCRWPGN